MRQQERFLRIAFAIGAVIDAVAIAPMLIPALARFMWGIEDMPGAYRFAIGYGAALMLGWTLLLVWAYKKPLERKAVALLTNAVIAGMIVTEVRAVLSGVASADSMMPMWVLQAALLVLFGSAYHYQPTQRNTIGVA